jgi:peptide deformylase
LIENTFVKEGSPILTRSAKPFDFNETETEPYVLAEVLQRMRAEGGGLGLAGPQVGWDTRIIVIGEPRDPEAKEDQEQYSDEFNQVFFNPEITEYSTNEEYMIEGCLTFPGLFIKVKRPDWIEIKWQTEEGSEAHEKCGGMTARILQHEVDHLNGILFQTKANRYHLEKARKVQKESLRLRKKQQNVSSR